MRSINIDGFCWHFLINFKRYGAEAERRIEAARDKDLCGRVTLQLGGTAFHNMYAVDLNLMTQANVANGNC